MLGDEAAVCREERAFDHGNPVAEQRTRWVAMLTAVTMVVEIIAGHAFNSMSLLADGWHMGTHVVALGTSALAYALARRYRDDRRFTFGTWKIEALGAFASALILLLVAIGMGFESVRRMLHQENIDFGPALLVAVIGLAVNLASVLLLREGHLHHHHVHDHDHDHAHGDPHDHGHQDGDRGDAAPAHSDLNVRAAYLHVIADAATSVLAIIALGAGRIWGVLWLDSAMGILGGVLVAVWALGLSRDTARVLLDSEMDVPLVGAVRARLEAVADTRVTDLHLWRIGRNSYACVAAVVSSGEAALETYRAALAGQSELVHITVEVSYPHPH